MTSGSPPHHRPAPPPSSPPLSPGRAARRARTELDHAVAAALHVLAAHPLPTLGALLVAASGCAALRVLRHREQRRWTGGSRSVEVLLPPEVDPAGAVSFWTNLHGLLRPGWARRILGQPPLVWDYHWADGQLRICLTVPGPVPPGLAERAVAAAWPGAQTAPVEAPDVDVIHATRSGDAASRRATASMAGAFGLARPGWWPLRTTFDADPLRALLGATEQLPAGWSAQLRIIARPAGGRAATRARRAAQTIHSAGHAHTGGGGPRVSGLAAAAGFGQPTSGGAADPDRGAQVRTILAKAAEPHWDVAIRYQLRAAPESSSAVDRTARRRTRAELRGRAHALASAMTAFTGPNALRRHTISAAAANSIRIGRHPLPLSVTELAALAHLPHDLRLAGVARAGARLAPVPPQAATAGKLLGTSPMTGRPVALLAADARYHLHVLGATGAGKSTLLTNMIIGDIAAGRGTVVIDPKGDLVTDVLDRIPAGAVDRVVLIDPDDTAAPPALDPLDGPDVDLAVDNLVGIFRRIFHGFWGPRTDDVLRAALLTLLHHRNAVAAHVPDTGEPLPAVLPQVSRLLTDDRFRRPRVASVARMPALASFWTGYEAIGEAQRAQIIAPLMNKLRAFLLRDYVANLVGSTTSSFRMDTVLDGGVLLARLPKGTLGEETSQLLGSFVIASIWQAATARARTGQSARVDAALYVDECQNFLNLPRSFEEVLAEARGYRLSLVLAHQHLGQLSRELREAISANARTKVLFNLSPEDARTLARHTEPALDEHDLAHLPAYTAAARLIRDGNELPAATIATAPPTPAHPGRAEQVRAAARTHWGRTERQRSRAAGSVHAGGGGQPALGGRGDALQGVINADAIDGRRPADRGPDRGPDERADRGPH